MFGGLDTSGDRSDLWAFSVDNQQWTQISPTGLAPGPRHGHAEILFAGSAPLTVGVLQVNVRIPQDIAGNSASVVPTIGGASSQKGVAVAIQ
jgi:uncharacterized protein (TIGR03437 family)